MVKDTAFSLVVVALVVIFGVVSLVGEVVVDKLQ